MNSTAARAAGSAQWQLATIPTDTPIWDRFFTPAPLVLVATKENGGYDVAPKHMATPLGWGNYFGFVCSAAHATYRNVAEHGEFTVSYPRADRILHVSLGAGPRLDDSSKPSLAHLPTFPATTVDGVLVEGCTPYLECTLDRIVDGFGENSLIVGQIVAAAAARDSLRARDIDDADLLHEQPPLVYLAPGRFGLVRETYAFPLPAGFRR